MKFRELLDTKWSLKSVIFSFTLFFIVVLFGGGYIYITHNSSFKLLPGIDQGLQAVIDRSVEKNPNFVAIQVVKVDLRKNIRFIEYTSIRDPETRNLYNTFVTNRITREVPVFTGKESQDSKMISIINHEFICYPFTDTISYEYVPELSKHISTVCSTTIPAFSGKFSGFIAVFLKTPPSATEKDIIRLESIKLSTESYNYIK